MLHNRWYETQPVDWDLLTKVAHELVPLAWPILVAVVVWCYRKELRGLFKSGFKGFGIEVPPGQEFVLQTDVAIAVESPAAAAAKGLPADVTVGLSGVEAVGEVGSVTVAEDFATPPQTEDPALNHLI